MQPLRFMQVAAILAFLVAIMLTGCQSVLDAIIEQDKSQDELRNERCTQWGDNIPDEVKPMCERVGEFHG